MEISVDISLYPLQEEYVTPILAFIATLEATEGIVVERNSLSTQVFGDYHVIMDMLEREIYSVLDSIPDAVFVLKLVGRNRLGMVDG